MAPMRASLLFVSATLGAAMIESRGRGRGGSVLAAWERDLGRDGKKNPIQKVVKLLTEMKVQLDKEAAADSEAYDQMVCWCESNNKEKTKAIADADAKIADLTSEVEGSSASDGRLGSKIDQLKKEIDEQQKELDEATQIRERDAAKFSIEERDSMQAVSMVKNAVDVLSKQHAGLIQMTPDIKQSLASCLRWAGLKHEELNALNKENDLFLGNAKPMVSLLQGASLAGVDLDIATALRGTGSAGIPPEYAEQILAHAAGVSGPAMVQQRVGGPATKEAYSPQSGPIFGILKSMKEEFESNLSETQRTEMLAIQSYKDVKASSEKEMDAAKENLDDLQGEHSASIKALSDAKEDLETTTRTRAADVRFLSDLRLQCQDLDRQWEERSKSRSQEIKAVAETIAILTEDSNKEALNKAASFLQVDTKAKNLAKVTARRRAVATLMRAARKFRRQEPSLLDDSDSTYKVWRSTDDKPHEQLAAMAMQVQLDAFSKIKKMMDNMIADLTTQQKEEVKMKDECNTQMNKNEKEMFSATEDLKDSNDAIESLADRIDTLSKQIDDAKTEIETTEFEIKKASQVREKENADFQLEVGDQRAVQAILAKALARMKEVYDSSLLQEGTGSAEDPTPPVQFQPMKENAGGSPVVSLIEQIIEDSKKVETESITAERKAQTDYEYFVNDANAAIQSLQDDITEKTEKIAMSNGEKEEQEAHRNSVKITLDDLAAYKGDLHEQCDFVLANFGIRQKARTQEIEAIQQAKSFLSGMQDDED